MGKRKSSSKPQGPKKVLPANLPPSTCRNPKLTTPPFLQRDPLPTTFTCLFCNHEKSVEVKLDKKAGCGRLECKICGQRFQCGINCRLLSPPPATGAKTSGTNKDLKTSPLR